MGHEWTCEWTMMPDPAGVGSAEERAECLKEETGQPVELEANVRRHARLVFKVAYGVLRNGHDAEDVVQETFLRAHRDGMRSVRDARAWLATVAVGAVCGGRSRQPASVSTGSDCDTAEITAS